MPVLRKVLAGQEWPDPRKATLNSLSPRVGKGQTDKKAYRTYVLAAWGAKIYSNPLTNPGERREVRRPPRRREAPPAPDSTRLEFPQGLKASL